MRDIKNRYIYGCRDCGEYDYAIEENKITADLIKVQNILNELQVEDTQKQKIIAIQSILEESVEIIQDLKQRINVL